MIRFLEALGRPVIHGINVAWEFSRLLCRTAYWIGVGPFCKKPMSMKRSFEQMVFMGVESILIVVFVCFFTGVVLAMQSAPQLGKMGATIYVASLVSISICRELGPVLTALVIAGRIGAAITAEIGSMKVNEQIEALETMAIDPVRYLLAPKLLALFLILPVLTFLGDLAGMLGGYVIGVSSLNINGPLYIQTAMKYLTLKDIFTGLSKPFVFAVIIAIVGAYQGLKTRGGAVGVGRATTISVVTSFIMIIIADALITAVYFFTDF